MVQTEIITTFNEKISSLSTCPTDKNLVLSTSWDGTLKLIDYSKGQNPNYIYKNIDQELKMPLSILNSNFLLNDKNKFMFVDQLNTLRIHDIKTTSQDRIIPLNFEYPIYKSFPVKLSPSLYLLEERGKNLHIIDISQDKNIYKQSLKTPEPIISMTMNEYNNYEFITTNKHNILIYDFRKFDKFCINYDLNIEGDPNCITVANDESFIIGTNIGKIYVEYFKNNNINNYSFKCHRELNENGEIVRGMVNCIYYNSNLQYYYSGGCDGVINCWNYKKIAKIFKTQKMNDSITFLDGFNNNNVIFGVTHLYDEGDFANTKYKNENYNYISLLKCNNNHYS